MTEGPDLEGGPGWYIDRDSLLPRIADEALFRAVHAEDPAVDILVALWTGHAQTAEVELRRRLTESGSLRLRALLADAARDQGRTKEAIATYESLIREVADTSSEAVMHQHLGKAFFVARRYREAAAAFEKALELRLHSGAEDALTESSRFAAQRAHEEAAGSTR
jgi:tetratricopeptide (TPR) repeat protein